MRRIISLLLVGATAMLFLGCASSVSSKGVIVKVYKPPMQRTGSLQCEGGEQTMSYIYVGSDTVKGDIKPYQKKLIASFARSTLKETSFITPVSNKFDFGYDDKIYPIMHIDVIKFSIKKIKQVDKVVKKGEFVAQIDIKTPGTGISCSSSEPLVSTINYQMPIYKEDMLVNDTEITRELVKDVIRRSVASFVPVTSTILRSVDTSEDKSAKMLDAGNCDMAKEYLTDLTKSKDSASVYYNLGVAYECLAKHSSIQESSKLLLAAKKFYSKAVILNPENKMYNTAAKEINDELKFLNLTENRSKDVKQYINNM